MLEFVLTHNIADCELIGIKYASIKVSLVSDLQYNDKSETFTNYVFPVKTPLVNTSNFCPYLSKYFKIISNYSGKELQILTDMLREPDLVWETFDSQAEESNLSAAKIYSSDGKRLSYKKSVFYRIEKALSSINFNGDDSPIVFKPISEEEIKRMFEDSLSELSFEILHTAVKNNEQISRFYSFDGLSIIAGTTDFTKGKTPREIAQVEEAFNELLSNEYIKSIGSKGEIFEVTEKGFDYIENNSK